MGITPLTPKMIRDAARTTLERKDAMFKSMTQPPYRCNDIVYSDEESQSADLEGIKIKLASLIRHAQIETLREIEGSLKKLVVMVQGRQSSCKTDRVKVN